MPKIILIEGLPKYERVNEAKSIAEALEVMKKSCDGRRARHLEIIPHTVESKADFINWLEKETDFLHVSAHGKRKKGKTVLKITRGSIITSEEIEKLNIKAKVIFVSACQQSRKDMADAFLKAGKPKYRYYIAPRVDVPFDEAFIVALLFYKKAFLGKASEKKRNHFYNALNYVYSLKDIKTRYRLLQVP